MKEDSQFLWIHCLNPDHDDQNPSCCVNKVEHNGNPVGFFYCYSCGWHGNMEPEKVRAMSKKKAVARKKKVINWNKLNMCYQMNAESSKPFDVSYHTLQQYSWGWDGEAHTFPMRKDENEFGEIIGIHRRFPDGQKCCVEGSQLGLFLPPYTTHVMGVVEGVSDACVALECGLPTIALPSASFGHKMAATYLKRNGVDLAALIPDNDEPGRNCMEKLSKILLTKDIKYDIIQLNRYNDLKEMYLAEGKKRCQKLLLR